MSLRVGAKYFLALICYCLFSVCAQAQFASVPSISLPPSGISATQLAVVYLQGDPLSERVARYYAAQRRIPASNVKPVDLQADDGVVDPALFAVQKKVLDAALSDDIQAYALAWSTPYRVGCMSMSAAFAFGFDTVYCAKGCKLTRSTSYFRSTSKAPYSDFSIRPTMMLAGETFDEVAALIARGIRADDTQPVGGVYLLTTSDKRRSVRKRFFPAVQETFANYHRVHLLEQNALKNTNDILFYFTGRANVEGLDTLGFLPGAMADHLTSYGGQLPESLQMSALAWLRAGATGSYGTAVEPCAFTQKFPNPYLAMWHYRSGASLLEAYWKSVQMPGQGNFIGEPLAAPFRGYRLHREETKLLVVSPVLYTGRYRIYATDAGFERVVGERYLKVGEHRIALDSPFSSHYRIERISN